MKKLEFRSGIIRSFACLIALFSCMTVPNTSWSEEHADNNNVLATWDNEQKVTMQDFSERYPSLVSWFGLGATAEQAETSLKEMVFDAVLAAEARKQGVTERKEIKAKIDNILAGAYLRSLVPREKIEVNEQELKRYYHRNRDNFKLPERWRVSQILTTSEESASAIYDALKKGASFEELAKAKSTDPASAQLGGNLGWVAPEDLAPALHKAALKLGANGFSKPVQTSFGYHIVRVDERPESNFKAFEAVKQEIYSTLFREKEQEKIDEVRSDLWSKYNVSLNDQPLKIAAEDRKAALKSAPGKITVPHESSKTAQEDPQLQLISNTIELGKVPADIVTREILVSNSSDQEIIIQRVASTCKCVQAVVEPRQLAPNQTAKLTLTYDPNMYKDEGETYKIIYVESTDSVQPRKLVRINAEVLRGGK
ncbi:MAG: peptidyl-prolyl cis-trans isomerase [Bdellovibrionales bacterium]|nr:peptidyl-prolyl cis-trans isomerase [Bdellovibrionales bacterium]